MVLPQTLHSYQIIVSIFGLIVGLFQRGFFCLFLLFFFNVYWANCFSSGIPQLAHPVTKFCKRRFFSLPCSHVFSAFGDKCTTLFPDPYFPPGKGPHIASVPGLVIYYHIYINGCMSSAKEFSERYRGMWRDNCMWVICWQASSWDADYVRITAKMLWLVLPLNFGRMISGPPQTVSRPRQYP